MGNSTFKSITETYFKRFSTYNEYAIFHQDECHSKMIVVVPCFNEPNIAPTLKCLKNTLCHFKDVYFVFIVNHGEHTPSNIVHQNEKSALFIKQSNLPCTIIKAYDLPKKHAGVGLARKIGMDFALSLFQKHQNDGIIVCFDADTKCEMDYFQTLHHHFQNHPKANGCAVNFLHPLQGVEFDDDIYEAICLYELHLRYYKHALAFTKSPYSHYTIGSSMAIKASAYAKIGGMNKRKAGEDFYFMTKLIALGNVSFCNKTHTIPSPRPSDRVPFGTGKAVVKHLNSPLDTYCFEAFLDLKCFFECLEMFPKLDKIPPSIFEFLPKQELVEMIDKIQRETASKPTFIKRCFNAFDGFWIMKFLHHYRDNISPNTPTILSTAKTFYETIYQTKLPYDISAKNMLNLYRKIDGEIIN